MDAGRMAKAPNRLTARVEIPAACGGRKPNKVSSIRSHIVVGADTLICGDFAFFHHPMPSIRIPLLECIWLLMQCLPNFHKRLKGI